MVINLDPCSQNRISRWIDSISRSASAPPLNHSIPKYIRKGKRAASAEMNNTTTSQSRRQLQLGRPPTKRSRTNDSLASGPDQSGSSSAQNQITTCDTSTSGDRQTSPPLETISSLRTARPPIWIDSVDDLQKEEALPVQVTLLAQRLAHGVGAGFIPARMEEIMMNDSEIEDEGSTDPTDFYEENEYSEQDLAAIWQKVKAIYRNALVCHSRLRDENAWSDEVVRPLIQLAIDLHGKGRWWMQNIKSQFIDPAYLSTVLAPIDGDSSRYKAVDRNVDYALSYSHHSKPGYLGLYNVLNGRGKGKVGPTTDKFTKTTAVFSGIEVKSAGGNPNQARLQIGIWIAASLRKKQELANLAQVQFKPAEIIEPVLTVIGHQHYVYVAYPRREPLSGEDGTQVLGPVEVIQNLGPAEPLSTTSPREIFQLIKLYGNILEYGIDRGKEGYWGSFLGKVLRQLAYKRLEVQAQDGDLPAGEA
ncbi:hypothetical protein BU24DRAFT_493574 [Aaosphaeria arxii CBS 175.79]|uniref:PD-(D/E)XK nuclease-like domain-containing protein n=1 Tax=Aaosphaeria arxii CBS 175.79 TaxID=1450172 RepID=A0A6A5XQS3_9PLEO|nr:uncharacterized protein BU24DRAFT_493574 [Aaosphaeria arxii CBS 175.79]KAF2015111.1 hypothetical protein BU24DRAFT_493574 [Aaosphaeria arxii CBS 175.79]